MLPDHQAAMQSNDRFGKVILAWLLVSAFYYADSVITGRINLDLDEGLLHKGFKYGVTLLLSAYIILRHQMFGMMLIPALLIIEALFILLYYPASRPVVDIHAVLICMSGLVMVLNVVSDRVNRLIPVFIVGSGVIVGIISMIELFVLAHLFQSRWQSIGGMRSISTLFNPNNLGLYLSVCLIFLGALAARPLIKLLLAVPIGFGLLFSGSRTAWASLAAVAFLSMVYSYLRYGDARASLIRPVRMLQALAAMAVALAILVSLNWSGLERVAELDVRGVDLHTADIRKENFLSFLGDIDARSLGPDVTARNTDLATDSAYLSIFNTFGLLPLVGYGLLSAVFYRAGTNLGGPFGRQWRYVVLFYLIAGLGNAVITAFPNNQMFFISLGAMITYRFRAMPVRPLPAVGTIA